MCPKTYTQYYYYKKHVTENHLWGCHILVPTTSQNMLAIIISGKLRSHSVVGRINYFKQIFLFVCCFFFRICIGWICICTHRSVSLSFCIPSSLGIYISHVCITVKTIETSFTLIQCVVYLSLYRIMQLQCTIYNVFFKSKSMNRAGDKQTKHRIKMNTSNIPWMF